MKTLHNYSYQKLFQLAIEKPIMAQLELTKNCNQSCFFCFRRCRPSEKFKTLSLKDWQKIIDKLVNLGVVELNLSGGEIFLFNKLENLLIYAKSHGIEKIIINTNGSINLSNKDLSLIDQIIFSIHGIDQEHDEIVGLKDAFKMLKKNLIFTLKQNKAVGINTVVSPNNYHSLKKIYNYFKDYNLTFHAFNLFVDRQSLDSNYNWYKDIFTDYLKFLQSIPSKKRKLRHGLQNVFYNNKHFFAAAIPLPHCAAGKYKLIIDYRGDVYPCRYFQEPNYLCGNILTGDAHKIWRQGKGFKKFRNLIIQDKYPTICKNCFKKYKCRGGCLAWRLSKNSQYAEDIRCQIGAAHLRG